MGEGGCFSPHPSPLGGGTPGFLVTCDMQPWGTHGFLDRAARMSRATSGQPRTSSKRSSVQCRPVGQLRLPPDIDPQSIPPLAKKELPEAPRSWPGLGGPTTSVVSSTVLGCRLIGLCCSGSKLGHFSTNQGIWQLRDTERKQPGWFRFPVCVCVFQA